MVLCFECNGFDDQVIRMRMRMWITIIWWYFKLARSKHVPIFRFPFLSELRLITTCNATEISKVDFGDGVVAAASLHFVLHLSPRCCLNVVLQHLQTKTKYQIISWRIPLNTSSLSLLPSRPPVTTTCWFKWAALTPLSALGQFCSALNNTFERFTHQGAFAQELSRWRFWWWLFTWLYYN